jgi:hypothetical protein
MRTLLDEREALRVDAFICLSRIETGLRSFIETEAPHLVGTHWRKALPDDVKATLGEAGLDVLYLADLRKILARYWSDLKPLNDRLEKNQLMVYLQGLDDVRNDVAHSRYVAAGALARVQAAYYLLEPVLLPYLAKGTPDDEMEIVEAILALQAAVLNLRSLPTDAVESLQRAGRVDRLLELALKYDRLVRQPGQSRELLNHCQVALLDEIRSAHGTECDD